MTRTEHNLPFSELSDRRFEQLCFALLQAEGHTDVRHWGDAGSEGGCDVVSTGPDGRRWVTQAKRVQSMGPKPAVAELTKVLADPPDTEPDVYLLAATCALSRTTQKNLAAAVAELATLPGFNPGCLSVDGRQDVGVEELHRLQRIPSAGAGGDDHDHVVLRNHEDELAHEAGRDPGV